MILTGPIHKPLSGDKPRSICVLLHGVGSNGDDLISLAPIFAEEFPDTIFISPNAPEAYEFGVGGYQWFPYYNRSHSQIIEGLEKASVIVGRYLQELLDEYKLPPEKLVLMGFSQGAMVSVHTGLTMQDNIAGVVSFSGGILKVDISSLEVRSNPPICLIPGEADEVVPCNKSAASTKILDNKIVRYLLDYIILLL